MHEVFEIGLVSGHLNLDGLLRESTGICMGYHETKQLKKRVKGELFLLSFLKKGSWRVGKNVESILWILASAFQSVAAFFKKMRKTCLSTFCNPEKGTK